MRSTNFSVISPPITDSTSDGWILAPNTCLKVEDKRKKKSTKPPTKRNVAEIGSKISTTIWADRSVKETSNSRMNKIGRIITRFIR